MEHDDTQRNRRNFSRIPFSGKVAVIGEHAHWLSDLLDISMKGVLITRPAEWPGQPGNNGYQLKVSIGDGDAKIVIAMDATLVHSNNECLGFRCEHIDLDSMTHLRRLLELNIGDEDQINRELSALIHMHHNNHSGGR